MPTDNLLTAKVAKFIESFPKKKKYTTDTEHFPKTIQFHCAGCYCKKTFYRVGVFLNGKKPEKDYRKWKVTYDCDDCKSLRSFKFIPPGEELKLIPSSSNI